MTDCSAGLNLFPLPTKPVVIGAYGRAPDCGSGGRGFKSPRSPQCPSEGPADCRELATSATA